MTDNRTPNPVNIHQYFPFFEQMEKQFSATGAMSAAEEMDCPYVGLLFQTFSMLLFFGCITIICPECFFKICFRFQQWFFAIFRYHDATPSHNCFLGAWQMSKTGNFLDKV